MVVAVDGKIFVHASSVVCGGLEISIYFGFRSLYACVEKWGDMSRLENTVLLSVFAKWFISQAHNCTFAASNSSILMSIVVGFMRYYWGKVPMRTKTTKYSLLHGLIAHPILRIFSESTETNL